MDLTPLEQTVSRIEHDPRSGQSLLLYALVKTLSTPTGGHAYLLTKLKEMTPDTRRLAYGLMEAMAVGGCETGRWREAVATMDRSIGR